MCGIAGFIQTSTQSSSGEAHLNGMLSQIIHRGPDDHGSYIQNKNAWKVHLGHRRLSIIDLSGSRQPIGNTDQSLQLSYNGEVYNYQEIRSQLEKKGHTFQTQGDAEPIVHLFQEKGIKAFKELNGMFALAIWNQKTGELTLARDRSGIKPLYYTSLPDGGIAFSSELSSLLEHPQIRKRVSHSALTGYFFSDYAHPPEALIDGVKKLLPGHSLTWKDGICSPAVPFWTLKNISTAQDSVPQNAPELLWEKMSLAVQRQLVSDVPLGIFLSGGVDSSVIAALAQKHSSSPIRTFSIGFEDQSFDESLFARQVAQHIGSHHTEKIFKESMIFDVLDQALNALDEPMADPSIVPTYLLAQMTREHVTVALGGDGGDELFGGYPTYKAHQMARVYQWLPKIFRSHILEPWVRNLKSRPGYQTFEWKAKRFALRWDDDLKVRHLRWMSNTDLPDLEKLMGANSRPAILNHFSETLFEDPLNEVFALDFQTYLPGSVLAKVDRASMAHSLEVRPPLLDNDLIDWVFSLPASCKFDGKTSKRLLKQAAEPYLPKEIIYRKKKGFGIPLAEWLRGPLKERLETIFKDSPVWECTPMSREVMMGWAKDHFEFRGDFAKTLWALIVLDHWMRKNF